MMIKSFIVLYNGGNEAYKYIAFVYCDKGIMFNFDDAFSERIIRSNIKYVKT
jgi:hypothetical protein